MDEARNRGWTDAKKAWEKQNTYMVKTANTNTRTEPGT
jgi:hypothetical protein